MKSRVQLLLIFLLLLGLFLMACSSGEAEPTATATAVPTNTSAPTDTPAPTNTAVPTNTPAPTNTPEPTATPDLTTNFVPFEDEFQGITLSHPAEWTAVNFFFTILASSEALTEEIMAGETPEKIEGAFMLLIGGSAEDFGADDPETLINEAINEFDFAEDVTIISGPTVTEKDGQQMVTMVARGQAEGHDVVVLYAVIINQELGRGAILLGLTTPEEQAVQLPTMEAIVSTVQLGEANMEAMGELFGSELGIDSGGFMDALPIFLDETLKDEIATFDPVYYSFSGAPTLSYDIVVEALDDNLDLALDLLDENGVSLLDGEVDETFAGGAEAIRGFQPEEYALFIVSVRGFAGSTGPFTISLMEAGAASTGGAELDRPGSQLLATTTIEQDGRALFVFEGQKGGELTAVVTPQGDLDLVVTIYDENDNIFLSVDDGWSGGAETLTFKIPAAGLYQLEVVGFAGAGGTFDMNLVASPDVILELFGEDMVNGWLDESGRTSYVISLEAGETLIVTAVPEAEFDLVIELLDADKWRQLDVDEGARGGAETLTFTAPSDGLYFIHIRGFAGAANGTFTMTVTVE